MKHVHLVDQDTSKIELTQGYWALVDTANLLLLTKYNWCVHKAKGRLYAKTQIKGRHDLYAQVAHERAY